MVQDGESAQTRNEQVCVQLPTSADNVALLAFPAEAPAVQQSIDISWPPGPQQQTRRNDGTDRQTDARQFHKPCPHTMRAVSTGGRVPLTGNESAPIHLAQCWFTGLAISNAKI